MGRSLLKNKKGVTVTEMVFYGLLIVVLGITLGIGAKVLDKMSGDMTISETVLNETISLSTSVNASVARTAYAHFGGFDVINIYNESDGFGPYVATTDYIAYSGGIISWLNTTDPGGNGAGNEFNISYSCSYCNDTSCSSIENSSLGVAELGSWTDTIALVIAGMVILGLVFGLFTLVRGFRR